MSVVEVVEILAVVSVGVAVAERGYTQFEVAETLVVEAVVGAVVDTQAVGVR